MMSRSIALFGAVVSMAAVAACSGLGFHGQQTPYGSGMSPNPSRGVNGAVAKSGTRGTQEVRRVCRNSGMATGWIAIDYVADSTGCSALGAGGRHQVALVVDYRTFNVGADLEVCGPERIPVGWTMDGWVDQNGRCPDDPPSDDPAKRTVKRIRRLN